LRHHDGELRGFLSRALPLRDAGGRVVRWFGTNVDVDAQKRAEDRARADVMREAAQHERERANAARVQLLKKLAREIHAVAVRLRPTSLGALEIESRPGAGTTVLARVPVRAR
jgi:hypothetical protein